MREFFGFWWASLRHAFTKGWIAVSALSTLLSVGAPFLRNLDKNATAHHIFWDALDRYGVAWACIGIFWAVVLCRCIWAPFWMWKQMRTERDNISLAHSKLLEKESILSAIVTHYFYAKELQEMVARVLFYNDDKVRRSIIGASFTKYDPSGHSIYRFDPVGTSIFRMHNDITYVDPDKPIIKEYRAKIPESELLPGRVFGIVIETINPSGRPHLTDIRVMLVEEQWFSTQFKRVSLDEMDPRKIEQPVFNRMISQTPEKEPPAS